MQKIYLLRLWSKLNHLVTYAPISNTNIWEISDNSFKAHLYIIYIVSNCLTNSLTHIMKILMFLCFTHIYS